MPQSGGSTFQRDGAWWARVRYTDANGKKREKKRRAESKAEAKQLVDTIMNEIDHENAHPSGVVHTFSGLADFYAKRYAHAPVYRNGERISGLRSHASLAGYLKRLREMLGPIPLRAITYARLQQVRADLLDDTIKGDKQRSLANLNRILATLRRMLTIAVQQGWLTTNPFTKGDPLINTGREKPRDRVMSRDEEKVILAVCTGAEREHLRLRIVFATETGARESEMVRVKRRDIDLHARTITLHESKTGDRCRVVPMTDFLHAELVAAGVKNLFPTTDLFISLRAKTGFATACRLAGVTGLQFRDLRTTCGTRLLQNGISVPEVAKILGHSDLKTTYRGYLALDQTSRKRAITAQRKGRKKG